MNRLRLLDLFLLLFCQSLLAAQESYTIPFRLAGKLFVVQGQVNGQTGNFIVDTGVEHLLLNERYFQGSSSGEEVYGILGEAGGLKARYINFHLGNRAFGNLYVKVVSLARLEQAKGFPIHGLIGMALLKNFELLIDFRTRQLTLFEIDRRGDTGFFYESVPADTIPFRWKGYLPCLMAQVANCRLNLAFDTGSEISLLQPGLRRRLSAYLTRLEQPTRIISFGDGSEDQSVCILQDLYVESWSCSPFRVFFMPMNRYNEDLPGPVLDGIASYELLGANQLSINFYKQEIYLWVDDAVRSGILVTRRPRP